MDCLSLCSCASQKDICEDCEELKAELSRYKRLADAVRVCDDINGPNEDEWQRIQDSLKAIDLDNCPADQSRKAPFPCEKCSGC
jgi:hypothetical protein